MEDIQWLTVLYYKLLEGRHTMADSIILQVTVWKTYNG